MDKELDVLLVQPMRPPREVKMDGSLESLQKAVGGMIECVYPFEDRVGIICTEEGKLNGLRPNRFLFAEDGKPYDMLCGEFLVVGLSESDFASLTPKQVERYSDLFSRHMILSRPPEHDRGR